MLAELEHINVKTYLARTHPIHVPSTTVHTTSSCRTGTSDHLYRDKRAKFKRTNVLSKPSLILYPMHVPHTTKPAA